MRKKVKSKVVIHSVENFVLPKGKPNIVKPEPEPKWVSPVEQDLIDLVHAMNLLSAILLLATVLIWIWAYTMM